MGAAGVAKGWCHCRGRKLEGGVPNAAGSLRTQTEPAAGARSYVQRAICVQWVAWAVAEPRPTDSADL